MNNTYGSYTNVRYGVSQGSVLGPLLCDINISDLFLWDYNCDLASYADDNTTYISDISLNLFLEKLESSTHDLFRWFKKNHMKANPDKCLLLVTTNSLTSVNINGFQITNRTEKKLLGIKFDSKVHVSSLFKKLSQKLHALTRIVNDMNFPKENLLRKHLPYCSLTTAH